MQNELDALGLPTPLQIGGINAIGEAAYNGDMIAGRHLPWLQDIDSQNVWSSWQVTYRDVVVLDTDNRRVYVYNLTENDLNDSSNYQTLKDALRKLAGGQ